MTTAEQIREARRLLKWAQWRLASKAQLGLNTVVLAENENGIERVRPEKLAKIEAALAKAGIVFTTTGVQLQSSDV